MARNWHKKNQTRHWVIVSLTNEIWQNFEAHVSRARFQACVPCTSPKLVEKFRCDKSVEILEQTCYNNPFVWLATACWRLVCCKLPTNLVQVYCQNLLSTGLLQVVSKVVTSPQMASSNKPNFNRLVSTCWQQTCCNLLTSFSKPIKLTTYMQYAYSVFGYLLIYQQPDVRSNFIQLITVDPLRKYW